MLGGIAIAEQDAIPDEHGQTAAFVIASPDGSSR
jgi:hypothetical protein